MKYAIVDSLKCEPKPGLKGECTFCGSPMIPKCGPIKIWHWAHENNDNCDKWSENESEWHRDWKNQFPEKLQEVVFTSSTGERHIADIQTGSGLIIEFQNSQISINEIEQRNEFYNNIYWVLNGNNLSNKLYKDFSNILSESKNIGGAFSCFEVDVNRNNFLKKWAVLSKPVFIDFQEEDLERGRVLWLIWPKIIKGNIYVSKFYFNELKPLLSQNNETIKLIANIFLKEVSSWIEVEKDKTILLSAPKGVFSNYLIKKYK